VLADRVLSGCEGGKRSYVIGSKRIKLPLGREGGREIYVYGKEERAIGSIWNRYEKIFSDEMDWIKKASRRSSLWEKTKSTYSELTRFPGWGRIDYKGRGGSRNY